VSAKTEGDQFSKINFGLHGGFGLGNTNYLVSRKTAEAGDRFGGWGGRSSCRVLISTDQGGK